MVPRKLINKKVCIKHIEMFRTKITSNEKTREFSFSLLHLLSCYSYFLILLQLMGAPKRRTFAYSASDRSIIITLCYITLWH